MLSAAPIVTVGAVIAAGAALRTRFVPARRLHDEQATHGTESRVGSTPSTADWAALLDAVAAEVRSGAALGMAWLHALERHDIGGAAVSPGRPLADSLACGAGDRDEAVVLQVAGAAAALGGPIAITLDAGAALLRERAALRADAAAHGAQARLSAKVLTAVPVGFAAWSAATSSAFRAGLASPVGAVSVVLGASLNTAGWWWMRALIARAAP